MSEGNVRSGLNPYYKSKIGFAFAIVPSVLYPFDVGSDINLAYHYYKGSWWKEFILTTTLITLPSLVNAIYLIFGKQRLNDATQGAHWIFDILLTLLLITPFLAILKYLGYFLLAFNIGNAYIERGTDEEITWLLGNIVMMGLIESFVEGIPQMILQVYIAASQLNDPNGPMGGEIWWSVYVAVVASLVSCSFAICGAYKAFTAGSALVEDDTKISYKGLTLMFFGHFIVIAVRIGSLVFLMVTSIFWFMTFCAIHWATMLIWNILEDFILSKISKQTDKNTFKFGFVNCISRIVRTFGSIFVFTYLSRILGTKFWKAHCALLFFENFAIYTFCFIHASGGCCDKLVSLNAFYAIILPQLLYIVGTICLQIQNVMWRNQEISSVRDVNLRSRIIQEITASIGVPTRNMFKSERIEVG